VITSMARWGNSFLPILPQEPLNRDQVDIWISGCCMVS
jgi:hypothetical protein